MNTNEEPPRWERVKHWLLLHTSQHSCSISASAYEELRKIVMDIPTKEEAPDEKQQ
jgi:hypothetical protein